jgi:hypothetical protein
MVSDLQRRVVEAVQIGAPLVEIESAIIEPAYLDEDEKAALWLYAEALLDRSGHEREPALIGN